MLTYIKATIQNNPYIGGLVIKSIANVEEIGDVASIVISRKRSDSSSWEQIHIVNVKAVEDLSFELVDYITLSGVSYSYAIDLMNANNSTPIESGLFENILCVFEGLFIGNAQRQYVAGSNFKTTVKRNTLKDYVTTLAGKYPYAVSNSELNYSTGSSSGLFLKYSLETKRFIPDVDHSYANEILDFLIDKTSKIIKTHDGQMWYVSIDANPSEVYSEYIGAHSISFNWTEIGEVPNLGLVGV